MKTVILNVSIGSQYVAWQEKLQESLHKHNDNVNCMFWTDILPDGCPEHRDVPYAFKPYVFMEARKCGFDMALWLDSPIICQKSIQPIWDYLENGPGYEFHFSWWKVGQWCSDAALQKHGISRDEAMDIHDNWACIMGLNFKSPDANGFLYQWMESAMDGVSFVGEWNNDDQCLSKDPRCMGHRHDQCISAILCHKMGLTRIPWEPAKFFAYQFQDQNDSVCLVHTR